ncbi:MAG TPA: hypothetical protein VGD23_04500 [Sphingomicrobium sp.]
MTDETGASSLICAAVDGLNRRCRVSLKLDGQPEWIEVEAIKLTAHWPGLFEVQRAAGHSTLMAPISRLVAIEVTGA